MMKLERQKAKLTHVNARMEIHGDERVHAADLKFSFDTSNDVLSEFDPALKSALYRQADGDAEQTQLNLGPGWLPKLRFPKLAPIDWEAEIVGGTLQVFYGLDSSVDLEIRIADTFKFTLKDGGTVNVVFRVQCKPTEEQIGRLCFLVQENVELSMWPPEPAAQQELIGGGETVAA
jgi:hypothetical protein